MLANLLRWWGRPNVEFDYLLDKISNAEFVETPFRHIYISDFFSTEHFSKIVGSPEIRIPPASDDAMLIASLQSAGFKVIGFPGTTTDIAQYIEWHNGSRGGQNVTSDTCEGFGITMRLKKPSSTILRGLIDFLGSQAFIETLAAKFDIALPDVRIDTGIQKYLDGYEISPHPDMRQKALTWMININPDANSESAAFHTHYMRMKRQYSYVQEYWAQNPHLDRCWVPWDWCETISQQTENNSAVLFAPSDNTLHAVRTSYDHLRTQRTQCYGNLWFHTNDTRAKPEWRDLQALAPLIKEA